MRVLAGAVLDDGADSVAADLGAPGVQRVDGESEFLEALDALGEGRLVRRFSAEEHVTYYNARVPFLLSLDEGTTSARAALYDEQGRRMLMESVPIECRYPQPGWVEQDAEEIWRAQIGGGAASCGARERRARESIAAIGITNQRETTIVWDRKTGKPVAPAIVWQCRRTAGYCDELAASARGADDYAKRPGW